MALAMARNPVATGALVALGLLAACGEPAGASAGAEISEVSRDLWYLVPDVDRLTTVWLGPEVRGPTGPPFRFLNVVHQGPGERFAAFSRPVVDPGCGAIAFTSRGMSIQVRPLTGDWRTVTTREHLEVTVELP